MDWNRHKSALKPVGIKDDPLCIIKCNNSMASPVYSLNPNIQKTDIYLFICIEYY